MLAQYFPINYKDDDGGPAPMALGTNGLAEAARITRDGVPHIYCGNKQIADAVRWAQKQTPPAVVHRNEFKPISQARGYVNLYRAKFYNGKSLGSLAKYGCATQDRKGNVAVIDITRSSPDEPGNRGLPGGALKGSLVKQLTESTARPCVGTLYEDVFEGGTTVKVALIGPECDGVDKQKRCGFKVGPKKNPLTITVDNDDAVTVSKIDVQRSYITGTDPRCSPLMPVPKHCDIFMTLSKEYREAVYYIDCLDHAYEALHGAQDVDIKAVKLTMALPSKVLRTEKLTPFGDIDAARAKNLKYPNMQGVVLLFKDGLEGHGGAQMIADAYNKCFVAQNDKGGFPQGSVLVAGATAKDVLSTLSPILRRILTAFPVAPGAKRKAAEADLNLAPVPKKKAITGLGKTTTDYDIDARVLCYALQDVFASGALQALGPTKLAMLLARAAYYTSKLQDVDDNTPLRVASGLATGSVDDCLRALRLAWLRRSSVDHHEKGKEEDPGYEEVFERSSRPYSDEEKADLADAPQV